LVADKEQSGYMKPYVEKIATDVRYADKSWGSYQIISVGENNLVAKATMKAGHRMSYHSHDFREEVWTVLSGVGRVVVDGIEKDIQPGSVITLPAGSKHTIIAKKDMTVLETQIGSEIAISDKSKYSL
jgi:mannose-1-phosphate guanylyltransferase